MPRLIVLDASVLAARILNEPEFKAETHDILERLTREEVAIHVPQHFFIEMANVLLMATRKRRISADKLEEHLIYLQNFPATTHDGSLPRIAALAAKHQLTIYDAAYLNVAMTLDADRFFTFDAALKKAAGVEGW